MGEKEREKDCRSHSYFRSALCVTTHEEDTTRLYDLLANIGRECAGARDSTENVRWLFISAYCLERFIRVCAAAFPSVRQRYEEPRMRCFGVKLSCDVSMGMISRHSIWRFEFRGYRFSAGYLVLLYTCDKNNDLQIATHRDGMLIYCIFFFYVFH